jgi:hypothetical protein
MSYVSFFFISSGCAQFESGGLRFKEVYRQNYLWRVVTLMKDKK